MSKFTGKSDFYDLVQLYSVNELLKSDVYTYDEDKLFFEDEADLLLYGPYLTGSMAASKNEDGTSYLSVHLSKQSYIDEREQELLFWYYLTLKNIVQKSKDCLADLSNPKYYSKYSVDLDLQTLRQAYVYVANESKLRDQMMAYPLKKMSYGDARWEIEKSVSDKVLERFHLREFNNRRLLLIEAYSKLTSRSTPKAIRIRQQIADYNSLSINLST